MKKAWTVLFVLALGVTTAQAASKKSPAKPTEKESSAGTVASESDSSKAVAAPGARSGKAGAFGLGADLQASLLGRYWLADKMALDFALGLNEMNFTSKFFWVPEIRAGMAFSIATIPVGIGTMPFYLGGGVGFQPFISSAFGWNLGIYGVAGFNFIPARAPIDVFAEVRPTFGIADSIWFGGFPLGVGSTAVGLRFVPTAGLRYYF